MAKFKIGDVVRLKSGGPDMTVILVCSKESTTLRERFGYEAYSKQFGEDVAYYGTNWFVGTKKEEGAFPESAIELSE